MVSYVTWDVAMLLWQRQWLQAIPRLKYIHLTWYLTIHGLSLATLKKLAITNEQL